MPATVLTQHNDSQRSGVNSSETELRWDNVNVNSFGWLCRHEVDGLIYAQPLYVPAVSVPGKGVRDLVIVATMENCIYALDAKNETGGPAARMWAQRLGTPVPTGAFRPGYRDIAGTSHRSHIGILSTPVIRATVGTPQSPSTGTIYVVAMTWDAAAFDDAPEQAFRHLLFALDLSTGEPLDLGPDHDNPVRFEGQVPGAGYGAFNRVGPARRVDGKIVFDGVIAKDHKSAEHPGPASTRPWPIQDGTTGSGGEHVVFSSMQHLQRPGLLLHDGIVYSAFGSHGDHDPYHGWIFAHDAATLRRRGVFCTTRNGAQAGVWQAGEGLGVDRSGHVYAGTGNGDPADAPRGAFGECLLKLKLAAGGLDLVGFSKAFVDPQGGDEDFGASSPTMLPDGRMVGGGKDGNFYLFDPAKMDPAGSPASQLQIFLATTDAKSDPGKTHHIHGSPVVFDNGTGTLVYVWGEADLLRCFRYDPGSHTFPGQPNGRGMPGTPVALGVTSASADVPPAPPGEEPANAMPGGMLSLSADGSGGATKQGSAIVWASFPPYDSANLSTVCGELRAYKADAFEKGRLVTLWSSRCNRARDDYGIFAKFCCPTVAGGRVYQATFNEPGSLVVYGLLKTPNGGYDIGFGGKTDLVFNGSASIAQAHVRLVEAPHLFQAGSVFHKDKVAVREFETVFTFQLPDRDADGFTFTVQDESPHALGGSGMGLGFGPDAASRFDRGWKIDRSVAVAFGFLNGSIGVYADGVTPKGGPTERPAGLDLRSGHQTRVRIAYAGQTLTVILTDLVTRHEAAHTFDIDLPGHTGPMAYVGFTGGSGARTSTQDIVSWSFASAAGPIA